MYIGIYENCFCLKYWKQSLLSVSLARFFFFFVTTLYICTLYG